RVVLLVYPALGGDGRVVEQREQYVRGRRERGDGRGTLRAQPSDGFVLTRLRRVHRTVVDQPLPWDLHHDLLLPGGAVHPIVSDPPDRRGGELPFGGDRLDVRHALPRRDHQHPFLRLGEQDLVRGHPGLARGHARQVYLHPDTAPRGHLGRRGRQPRGAHVLDRHDVARGV